MRFFLNHASLFRDSEANFLATPSQLFEWPLMNPTTCFVMFAFQGYIRTHLLVIWSKHVYDVVQFVYLYVTLCQSIAVFLFFYSQQIETVCLPEF